MFKGIIFTSLFDYSWSFGILKSYFLPPKGENPERKVAVRWKDLILRPIEVWVRVSDEKPYHVINHWRETWKRALFCFLYWKEERECVALSEIDFRDFFAVLGFLVFWFPHQTCSCFLRSFLFLRFCWDPLINQVCSRSATTPIVIASKMATRRYTLVGRGRPPLSAHSHQVNSVNSKTLDGNNFTSHVIKTKAPSSPAMKGSKASSCTPDVYTKQRSLCPILRPQVCLCPPPVLC